jgi:hypothetical protein
LIVKLMNWVAMSSVTSVLVEDSDLLSPPGISTRIPTATAAITTIKRDQRVYVGGLRLPPPLVGEGRSASDSAGAAMVLKL